MPLIESKSPLAFKTNLKREMEAGKPMKQSLAIAYNVKRKNMMKAKGGMIHCAHGGKAMCNKGCYDEGGSVGDDSIYIEPEPTGDDMNADTSSNLPDFLKNKKYMAKGGEVNEKLHPNYEPHGMKKSMHPELFEDESPDYMADGGKVSEDTHFDDDSEEFIMDPNHFERDLDDEMGTHEDADLEDDSKYGDEEMDEMRKRRIMGHIMSRR